MKKWVFTVFLVISSVLIFGSQAETTSLLNASRPGAVVSQPYFVRFVVLPDDDSSFRFGAEGHLSLLGLNLSLGATGRYESQFTLDEPVYVGLGLNLGALFASVSAKTESIEHVLDLSKYNDLKVAFGLVGTRRTSILVASWSRFELSYQLNNLLRVENGQIKFAEEIDWFNASTRLVIESYENGYFKFEFLLKDIKKALDGEFIYEFVVALPLSPLFFVQVCQREGNWILGAGAALSFAKFLVTYESNQFLWSGVLQF